MRKAPLSARRGRFCRAICLTFGRYSRLRARAFSLGCRSSARRRRTARSRSSPSPAPPPGLQQGERRRRDRRLSEALRRRDQAEPMIAVELAHDFDHLIDGLHVAGGHRTVGDEHRLVQAADLELDEFVRPIDGALCEDRGLALSRPSARCPLARRDFLDGRAGCQLLDEPQVSLRYLALGGAAALGPGLRRFERTAALGLGLSRRGRPGAAPSARRAVGTVERREDNENHRRRR